MAGKYFPVEEEAHLGGSQTIEELPIGHGVYDAVHGPVKTVVGMDS